MTDDERRLFWRLVPLALLAGALLAILTKDIWWMPGVGYTVIP